MVIYKKAILQSLYQYWQPAPVGIMMIAKLLCKGKTDLCKLQTNYYIQFYLEFQYQKLF